MPKWGKLKIWRAHDFTRGEGEHQKLPRVGAHLFCAVAEEEER
jgi:hypothetical protein